ncbi:MAG TPA: hypothetical protein VJ876_04985 [Bacteroidales bacterium]|nr:hypothetical protein [Bacteroidales bacterium]
MKKLIFLWGLTGAFLLASGTASYSQSFIKKLKKKAEEKVIEKAFGEQEEEQEARQKTAHPSMTNTRGEGLVTTAPNVNKSIEEAETAFREKEFARSRYAIRQAILGVEMEIGANILKGLPDKVESLDKDPERDRVTSTSIGFVGLTVERVYTADDQQLEVTVGNDAAILSAVNMYMASGAYAQSSDEQDYKEVDFQGRRGILEYDDYEGYSLSVPFGQSSVLVVNGVNFVNEEAIMKAAGHFNLDQIKKQLEEQ